MASVENALRTYPVRSEIAESLDWSFDRDDRIGLTRLGYITKLHDGSLRIPASLSSVSIEGSSGLLKCLIWDPDRAEVKQLSSRGFTHELSSKLAGEGWKMIDSNIARIVLARSKPIQTDTASKIDPIPADFSAETCSESMRRDNPKTRAILLPSGGWIAVGAFRVAPGNPDEGEVKFSFIQYDDNQRQISTDQMAIQRPSTFLLTIGHLLNRAEFEGTPSMRNVNCPWEADGYLAALQSELGTPTFVPGTRCVVRGHKS